MRLYDIDAAIAELLDEETGEIFDIEKFEALSIERDSKVESICLWIKNLNAEAEALKAEKQAFEKRQKSVNNKIESLKNYISSYLGGTKFKTAKVDVSFRSSEKVEIDDLLQIPDDYLRYQEPEVDKTKIKNALKDGVKIDGVHLEVCSNIQIK